MRDTKDTDDDQKMTNKRRRSTVIDDAKQIQVQGESQRVDSRNIDRYMNTNRNTDTNRNRDIDTYHYIRR